VGIKYDHLSIGVAAGAEVTANVWAPRASMAAALRLPGVGSGGRYRGFVGR
jgi:hypothetical protein